MSELKWNEYDFVECLGILPEVEEYETNYVYKLENNGLVLLMTVFPFESLIAISIYQIKNDQPFITFWFVVRGDVRHVKDKRGDYLEFCHIVVVENRSYYLQSRNIHEFPHNLNLELRVDPQFSLNFT